MNTFEAINNIAEYVNNKKSTKEDGSYDATANNPDKSWWTKFVNWVFTENSIAKAITNSKVFKGLSGETTAQATLEANERNIANQNYWNQIAMQREDTAHQREVADLQAAGLNPWLSMGNGAQSTAMSTAQADPVDGSKILSATSAMALMAVVKLLLKK